MRRVRVHHRRPAFPKLILKHVFARKHTLTLLVHSVLDMTQRRSYYHAPFEQICKTDSARHLAVRSNRGVNLSESYAGMVMTVEGSDPTEGPRNYADP